VSGSVKTLMGLFGMTDFLMPLVLDDLSDEQARERSRGEVGPSIAWTVGHLLYYRVHVLNLLSEESENPYEASFGKAAATDGSDYPSVAELGEAWLSVGDDFMKVLSSKSEEELDFVSEGGAHDERSVRDQIVFFAWHEGYHVGAIGTMRKSLGLLGPAEKVMALREADAAK
jgi:uncharacterized damage-inducible protein DinB